MAGPPLLCRQGERAGVVQPGEVKSPGRSYSSLPVPERKPTKKAREVLFTKVCSDRTRGDSFKLRVGLVQIVGRNFLL